MKLLQYKGYYGSLEASIEDNCLHGKIEFISALVTYEAENITDIEKEFQAAVNDYLETCTQLGNEPEISCKGSFNVRIGSDLHKQALLHAKQLGLNLNEFIKLSIKKAVT